jgi:hypothetical protein
VGGGEALRTVEDGLKMRRLGMGRQDWQVRELGAGIGELEEEVGHYKRQNEDSVCEKGGRRARAVR